MCLWEKLQEVLQLDWGRAFLNIHALQVVTASDANVKRQIISAIVAHTVPQMAYLLHFAIIHKLSAIFTKGQWMWVGTNCPEKVIHNLSAISMKGQLFMNRYHFDNQFSRKKWYTILVPFQWRVNYLWISTIFLVSIEIWLLM